jgi:hypothetical protein
MHPNSNVGHESWKTALAFISFKHTAVRIHCHCCSASTAVSAPHLHLHRFKYKHLLGCYGLRRDERGEMMNWFELVVCHVTQFGDSIQEAVRVFPFPVLGSTFSDNIIHHPYSIEIIHSILYDSHDITNKQRNTIRNARTHK